MEKQKKQLIGLAIVLILAVIAFVAVSKIPDEDESSEETVSYEVTNLNTDEVTKLVYTNENGTLTLSKSGDEWTCEEDKSVDIDEDTVNTMVGKVAALTSENKIENVEDISQYGLDNPSITILVSDGTNFNTLLIGDYNTTTYTYYLCLEDDTSTVYTTDSATISSFQNNTIEDITTEPETETETETTTETEETTETETAVETETAAESEESTSTQTEESTTAVAE